VATADLSALAELDHIPIHSLNFILGQRPMDTDKSAIGPFGGSINRAPTVFSIAYNYFIHPFHRVGGTFYNSDK
jgi:hypothetical protein